MTSLYRRHRPRTFDDVVGQEHVTRTLRNAVEQDKVHHAYLFVGSRGTGKTSMAKILASALNPEEADAIAAGTSLDVIEMDAASNRSVDDIRDLRERVGYAPAQGRWKVYILDEAHMLTKEAWNAFLKTLEEPPPNTVFVLCTTEAHKVMPTIVDRCQRFDFQRPSIDQVAEVLARVAGAEGIELGDAARMMIARAAAGSFRDALGTLDQLVSFGGSSVELEAVMAVLGVADAELVFDAADAIASSDPRRALAAVEKVDSGGRDLTQYARDVVAHLRHLLVARTTGEMPMSFAVTASDPDRVLDQARRIDERSMVRAIDAVSAALREVREGADPRVMLEVALVKASRPDSDPTLEALAERVARLESGGPVPSPPEPAEASGPAAPDASAGVEAAPEPASPSGAAAGGEPIEPAEPPDAGAAPEPTEPAVSTPEPAASPEALDLAALETAWRAVADQLRGTGHDGVAALLQGARPVAIEGGRAVIGFPSSYSFNRRRLESPEGKSILTEALAACGAPLEPAFCEVEEAGEPAGSEEPAVDEDAIVARLEAEFSAEEEPPAG